MKNTLQIKVAELRKANDNKDVRISELQIQLRDTEGLKKELAWLKAQNLKLLEWKVRVTGILETII